MKKYLLKNKWWALGYLVLLLVSSAMSVYFSILLGDIIDVALDFNLTGFWDLILFVLIFFAFQSIINYFSGILGNVFRVRTMRDIRKDIFNGIMKQDIGSFDSVNSADYISALTNDIQILEGVYFGSLTSLIFVVPLLIFSLGAMFYLNWLVATVLIVVVAILLLVQNLFRPLIQKRQMRVSDSLSAFTIKIKDIFSGFEVIKSYQMKNHSGAVFAQHNDEVANADLSLSNIFIISGSLANAIGVFLQVGIVFFSSYLIIQGQMYPGAMVAILLLSGNISGLVQSLGHHIPGLTGSKELIERLMRFANMETSATGIGVATFEDVIKVENLDFTYPNAEEPALKQVDFTFKKNKKYALLGKSGCGKTTLAKALIGYLNDYEGNVRYDGAEVRDLASDSFGKLPAMVHQNVYMFDEDIESNIGLHQSYTTAELEKAVKDSGVDLFLNEERTLQSAVGENGSNLSGGQRQRIAVARALIQNKPLLILDEGTSAVDRQTGADIENRLLRRHNLTLITITHSLDEEMLSQYDEIIYMEEGSIIEHGSFDDLVKQDGKFSNYLSV